MDPISLSLTVAGGLATAFVNALQVWAIIDAGRHHARDFDLLRTRLDNQRVLFLQWAARVGFGSKAGYNRRLDSPHVAAAVADTLRQIALLFSDARELEARYGLRLYRPGVAAQSASSSSSSSLPSLKALRRGARSSGDDAKLAEPPSGEVVVGGANSRATYHEFVAVVIPGSNGGGGGESAVDGAHDTFRQQQKNASIWQATTWSIRDDKKFEELVTHISLLVSDLERMTEGIEAPSFPAAMRVRFQRAFNTEKGAARVAKKSKKDKREGKDVVEAAGPSALPAAPSKTTEMRIREITDEEPRGDEKAAPKKLTKSTTEGQVTKRIAEQKPVAPMPSIKVQESSNVAVVETKRPAIASRRSMLSLGASSRKGKENAASEDEKEEVVAELPAIGGRKLKDQTTRNRADARTPSRMKSVSSFLSFSSSQLEQISDPKQLQKGAEVKSSTQSPESHTNKCSNLEVNNNPALTSRKSFMSLGRLAKGNNSQSLLIANKAER